MPSNFARGVSWVVVAFFGAFFFWPILQILRGGFVDSGGRFTLSYLSAILGDPTYLTALRNSALLAVAATALAFLISIPLALLSDRFEFPGKRIFASLVLLPMILPPFVGAIGLRQIFGRCGALNASIAAVHLRPAGWTFDWLGANRFWAVAAMDALSLFPIVYLNATAALANVDPALEEAAENLGCTALRRFLRVTLPLIRPGLFAGGTIVFIWAFTDLGTPLMLDYPNATPVQIYYGLQNIGGNPLPYALVFILLAGSALLYAGGKGLFGKTGYSMMAKATSSGAARSLPPAKAWLCTAAFAGVTAVALLPHLGVAGVAFARDWYASVLPERVSLDNFRMALGHGMTVPAIANSLKFAGCSAAADIVFGTLIAWIIVRSRGPERQALDILSMLPLAVPGLVLAFGYLAMAQPGRLFAFLDPVQNPTVLLIVAYSFRRLPYVVRSAAAGFQQIDVALEEAAQTLGSPPLKAVVRITLPLMAANLIAGGLLAFAFAMLEVSDSLVLAQKQAYYPITKAILELFQLLGDGRYIASALGIWAMAFLGVTIAGVTLLLGKRLGAMFRV